MDNKGRVFDRWGVFVSIRHLDVNEYVFKSVFMFSDGDGLCEYVLQLLQLSAVLKILLFILLALQKLLQLIHPMPLIVQTLFKLLCIHFQ